MPLSTNTTFGHYFVTAKIGSGGMGEVYRARDTKLDRDVALKVLPEAFTSDPDRLARFEREAKVLASLNHPNIWHIYGLEESDDTRALVLELVEGPTLADRIAQGPIPVDEALPIAKQIAEALEAAHEQGIIHRDLKPANIKLRPDGTVKVLDFGLAKALDLSPEGDPSQSPTMTAAATQQGVILGTAAYMSPEQARGKTVDRRADVWAFGAVLYEMLAGQRAFGGEDVSDTLVSVFRDDADWSKLSGDVPERVRQALHVCLRKDPRQRVGDLGAVRLAMDGAFETRVSAREEDVEFGVPELRFWQQPLTAALIAVLVSAGAAAAVWSGMRPGDPVAPSVRRFGHDIGVAEPYPLSNIRVMPTWSPDGTRLVYAANLTGTPQLYLRNLADLEARPIGGTENAESPFFSPDGEWLGACAGRC